MPRTPVHPLTIQSRSSSAGRPTMGRVTTNRIGTTGRRQFQLRGHLTLATTYSVKFLVARARALFARSEEHTSELQSRLHIVCRLLLEKKKIVQGSYLDGC